MLDLSTRRMLLVLLLTGIVLCHCDTSASAAEWYSKTDASLQNDVGMYTKPTPSAKGYDPESPSQEDMITKVNLYIHPEAPTPLDSKAQEKTDDSSDSVGYIATPSDLYTEEIAAVGGETDHSMFQTAVGAADSNTEAFFNTTNPNLNLEDVCQIFYGRDFEHHRQLIHSLWQSPYFGLVPKYLSFLYYGIRVYWMESITPKLDILIYRFNYYISSSLMSMAAAHIHLSTEYHYLWQLFLVAVLLMFFSRIISGRFLIFLKSKQLEINSQSQQKYVENMVKRINWMCERTATSLEASAAAPLSTKSALGAPPFSALEELASVKKDLIEIRELLANLNQQLTHLGNFSYLSTLVVRGLRKDYQRLQGEPDHEGSIHASENDEFTVDGYSLGEDSKQWILQNVKDAFYPKEENPMEAFNGIGTGTAASPNLLVVGHNMDLPAPPNAAPYVEPYGFAEDIYPLASNQNVNTATAWTNGNFKPPVQPYTTESTQEEKYPSSVYPQEPFPNLMHPQFDFHSKEPYEWQLHSNASHPVERSFNLPDNVFSEKNTELHPMQVVSLGQEPLIEATEETSFERHEELPDPNVEDPQSEMQEVPPANYPHYATTAQATSWPLVENEQASFSSHLMGNSPLPPSPFLSRGGAVEEKPQMRSLRYTSSRKEYVKIEANKDPFISFSNAKKNL